MFMHAVGEAVGNLIVLVFIFGGGMFTFTLLRFWVATLVQNHRRRIHARQVADNCVRAWIEHI